jgi:hypothetical protein
MEPTSPIPEPQPAAPMPPPQISLAARLLNVFAAPGDVFESVKAAPVSTANWLVPALMLVLVGWVGAWVLLSQDSIKQQLSDITSKAIERQIEKGKIPKERAEAAREAGEKWGSIGTKISMVAGPPVVAFASPFWWGLILWLGTKVLKARSGYMKAVEMAGLANMIGVLETIVRALLAVSLGSLFATPSLALLVKEFDPNNTLHGILAVFNLLLIWEIALKALGLARLCGTSFGRAAAWVFGIWVAYTAFFIGLGAALRAVFSG